MTSGSHSHFSRDHIDKHFQMHLTTIAHSTKYIHAHVRMDTHSIYIYIYIYIYITCNDSWEFSYSIPIINRSCYIFSVPSCFWTELMWIFACRPTLARSYISVYNRRSLICSSFLLLLCSIHLIWMFFFKMGIGSMPWIGCSWRLHPRCT